MLMLEKNMIIIFILVLLGILGGLLGIVFGMIKVFGVLVFVGILD